MKYLDIRGYDSNIHISRLAMGSAMSMMRLPKEEIFRLFDIYLDAGGNCLDTARSYGNGKSEEMVGEYLRSSGKRNQVVVTTKGCHPVDEDMTKSRLLLKDLEEDINLSLKTLNTDCIDLYWIHKDDETLPVEGIVDNINKVIKEGKAKLIGCSNWHIDRIEAANKYAKESGQIGFLASQIQWSFTDTLEEYFKQYGAVVMDKKSYDWYLEQKMPVFAFSSQAQGFCARIAAGGIESLPMDLRKNYETADNMIRYERAKKYAELYNVSIAAPVLGYIVNNKLPGVAIIGAETPDMLYQSLKSAEIEMSADQADLMYQI